MSDQIKMTSNKPYIVGAFYDWISDNELTPYIVVDVSVFGVQVPMSFVNDGQIVLNISAGAVGSITMGEQAIEFTARFGGKLEHLVVPYGAIGAIYAKENGAGTSLPIEHTEAMPDVVPSKPKKPKLTGVKQTTPATQAEPSKARDKAKSSAKPSLKVIK
ncbi:ClpXP protease specificity-enhancing factor [Colwellia sp. MEBiC06753]